MTAFAITERTCLHRVPERGNYDKPTIHAILDAGFVCHLGFEVDGQPYVIPTTYGRADDILYVHGSVASRMLRNVSKGVPVCVTVTHLDGLVLARSMFHHSMNYRSVVVLGTATQVQGATAKLEALKALSEHIVAGRWQEVRPPSARELRATSVLSIPLVEVSAKTRTGPPVDDDEDYSRSVWAGVIPLALRAQEPVPDNRMPGEISLPGCIETLLKRMSAVP